MKGTDAYTRSQLVVFFILLQFLLLRTLNLYMLCVNTHVNILMMIIQKKAILKEASTETTYSEKFLFRIIFITLRACMFLLILFY